MPRRASGSASRTALTHLLDLPGHRAAVRVAERERLGSAAGRRAQSLDRVPGVGLVAVEEMLRVVDHAPSARLEKRDALLDHAQVLLESGTQHLRDVHVPGLAEDRADRRFRCEQGLKLRVVLGAKLGPAGRAERRDRHVLPLQVLRALEELDVLRIRARPAAFDERHPEGIQVLRDTKLVVAGQAHAFHLRAVTQRGVVDLHDGAPAAYVRCCS